MPMINVPANPPAPAPGVQQIPAALTDKQYKHSLVDVKQTPYAALLTHIEGSPWTTDYYSQILAGDEALSPFQLDQLPPYQQYLLIHQYEIRLQDSLSVSYAADTGTLTVTGSAMTYPGLKPQVGDAFLAEIGDGRVGQFTVTSSNPKSMLKEAVYEINFELARIGSEEVIQILDKCAIKEAFFRKDYLTYGQDPVLTTDEMQLADSLTNKRYEMLDLWLKSFYSSSYGTVLVPGQGVPTYDPYVTNFMLNIFEMRDHPLLKQIRELNMQDVLAFPQFNLWQTLLTKGEYAQLAQPQKCKLISSASFFADPRGNSVRYSGVKAIVYPIAGFRNVDQDYEDVHPFTDANFTAIGDTLIELGSLLEENIVGGGAGGGSTGYIPGQEPIVHYITKDDFYVFTDAFYNNGPGQSKLELLVNAYLRNDAVDPVLLNLVIGDIKNWGRLEKYYYLPAVLLLTYAVIRAQ